MANDLGMVFANRIDRNSSPTTPTVDLSECAAPRRTHHSMHAMRPARQKTITMASTGIDFLTSKTPLKLLKEKPAGYTNTDIDVKTERIQT